MLFVDPFMSGQY